MRPSGSLLTIAILAAGLIAAPGCRSSHDRSVSRMMWYRPGAKAPAEPNTITVGRFGRDAEYGTWPASKAVSGEWNDRGVSFGRYGDTAAYSTWGPTGTGGPPIDNRSRTGVTGFAGARVDVTGGTATVGETGRGGATYGTIP